MADAPTRQWLKPALWAVGGLAVVAVLFLAFGGLESSNVDPPEGIDRYPDQVREHTEVAVQYDVEPPVGGPHNPAWLNCGNYSFPVPSENAVHSLEHGVVWITYDPDLPEDQVRRIRNFGEEPETITSPYPNLPAPVVASVWGNQILLDSADDPRLKDFVRSMKNGPDTPEPSASCLGGVGIPDA